MGLAATTNQNLYRLGEKNSRSTTGNPGETIGLDLGAACCGGWTGAITKIHGQLSGFQGEKM